MRNLVFCAAILALALLLPVQGLVINVKYPDGKVNGGISVASGGCGVKSPSAPLERTNLNTYSITLDCSRSYGVQTFQFINGPNVNEGKGFLVNVTTPQQKSGLITVYPYFTTESGVYLTIPKIYSPQLDNSRDIVVYLPPSVLENGLRPWYPTLVTHDGQNMFNESTAFDGSWRTQQTIESLLEAGKMEEIVVVAVYNNENRTSELTYSVDPEHNFGGAKGNLYLDFIRDTVLPTLSKKFPLTPDVMERGILGASLGGLMSCFAGWTRPDEYTRAACMSSSFWWNSEDFNNDVMVQAKPPSPKRTIFYLDSGDTGDLQDDLMQTIRVHDHMEKLGWTSDEDLFYYRDHGGGHSTPYWRDRLWIPLVQLFPKNVIDPSKGL